MPRALWPLLFAPLATLPVHASTGGVPITVSHSGFLLDARDAPLEGSFAFRFRLYPTATGGSAEWEGACGSVLVSRGYYAVQLGGASCAGTGGAGDSVLDTSDLPPGSPRWLEVQLGADTMAPRVEISSLPGAHVASRAIDADQLSGHAAADFALASHAHAASEVSGLAPVATGGRYADLTGVPTTFPPASHTHAATQVTGLAPVATTGAWNDLTGKPAIFPADPASLAGATISGAFAATTMAASGGFSGAIKLGNPTTCDAAAAGTLRWTGTEFQGCNGVAWQVLGSSNVGTQTNPGASCKAIKQALTLATDTVYWIDPDGSGSNAAFQVFCDMTTDGGGWTLVGLTNSATELNAANVLADASNPAVGNYVKPLKGATGTDTRYECGASGSGVLGSQYTRGTWSWTGALLTASQAAPYSENVTWRVKVPGYDPPTSEAADAWGNHVGGVHYPNFGYTGFSAIDGRIFRQGVFTCDPQNTVYGVGDTAWASTSGTRYVRYWLR